MDWGHSQVLADVVDCCGMSHVRPIQLLRGCHIVERVVPAGVAGLNMKISGIVQHQQNLPVLGAGLGAFSIQGYRKFLTGVPGSIHARTSLPSPLRFQDSSQVNAALLANFLVVALDVVNQLSESLVDGLVFIIYILIFPEESFFRHRSFVWK